jgi:alanine racemase
MNCWVEVNRDAIRHNYREIKHLVGDGTSVIAVIKANAYGHGAIEVARVLSAESVYMLAVTRLDEALPIRAAGVLTPILLLAPALPDELEEVIAQNLTACVATEEDARRLSEVAQKMKLQARVHLKVNAGMGRLGVEPDEAVDTAARISQLPGIDLQAAFTHMAYAAEPDPSDTHHQFAKFQPLIHFISRYAGVKPQAFHCANSVTLLRFPAMRLTCVRPGTILYGQYPSKMAAEAAQSQRLELRTGFKVKARVLTVREVKRGQTVGYGGEWRARRNTRIATIAVGYADGLTQEPDTRTPDATKALRNAWRDTMKRSAQVVGLKGADPARFVKIKGEQAPIIGRIAMQQCSIDINAIPSVEVGDEVEVTMRRISAGSHLPRVYVDDEK